MCVPFNLVEYFLILVILWSVNSQVWIPGETVKTPWQKTTFPPPILAVFSLTTYLNTAIHNHITSMKKPGGERILIVSLFHRLQAVRALCEFGSQSRTQALVHEKIQCIKQLGLKLHRATNSSFMSSCLFPSMSYSLCNSLLFLTLSNLSPLLPRSVSKGFYWVRLTISHPFLILEFGNSSEKCCLRTERSVFGNNAEGCFLFFFWEALRY